MVQLKQRFKKGGSKESPAIPTSSLPDIIFILLFFFMVITVMRDVTLKVKYKLPEATELTKLEKKSLVSYIYMGPPTRPEVYGDAPRIQLDDAFAQPKEVQKWVVNTRNQMPPAKQGMMIVALRIDKETKMGLITEVKQELRKADALKINYSTLMKVD
jgi:biopolymer transport protein ExbD